MGVLYFNEPLTSGSSAPFTPPSVPGCLWWARSDLGITINPVNGRVSRWADQLGSGNDLTQSSNARQFHYSASGGGNNRPYLLLQGGLSQRMLTASNFPMAKSIWWVARSTWPGAGPPSTWILGGTVNIDIVPGGDNASTNTVQIDDQSTTTAQVALTQNADFGLLAFNDTNGISALYLNNDTGHGNSADALVNFGSGVLAVGDSVFLGDCWDGFVYEIAIYNALPSSTNRTRLQTYAHNLYGI